MPVVTRSVFIMVRPLTIIYQVEASCALLSRSPASFPVAAGAPLARLIGGRLRTFRAIAIKPFLQLPGII
jgi:hypothetical protein